MPPIDEGELVIEAVDDEVGVATDKIAVEEPPTVVGETPEGTETVLISVLELCWVEVTLLSGYVVTRLLLCPKEMAVLVALVLMVVLLETTLLLEADVIGPKAK